MLHHLKSSPAYAHHLAQGRCCSCTSSPPLRLKLVDMLVMSCREGIKIIKHPISSTSNDKWKWWWCAISWYHELIISNHVPWYHKFPPLNRVSMFPHTFRHVPIPSLCIPRHTWRGWWSFRSSCWLQTSAMAPVGPASGWNQKWPPSAINPSPQKQIGQSNHPKSSNHHGCSPQFANHESSIVHISERLNHDDEEKCFFWKA